MLAKLHAFWDDLLGKSEDPRAAVSAATQLPEPDPRSAPITDEKVWIQESFEAAKASVYVSPIEVGGGPFALTDGYKSNALTLAKERAHSLGRCPFG